MKTLYLGAVNMTIVRNLFITLALLASFSANSADAPMACVLETYRWLDLDRHIIVTCDGERQKLDVPSGKSHVEAYTVELKKLVNQGMKVQNCEVNLDKNNHKYNCILTQ